MDLKVTIITATLASAVQVLVAQAPASPQPEKKKAVPDMEVHSSRNLLGESKAAWIAEMRTKLPIASRQIGPFGMAQDPNVQIAQKKKSKPKPGAFLNAIKAMKINAVIANEQKFIIGSREFFEGDAFPIVRGQRQFNIKIVDVKSEAIVFMNVDTGEHVQRNLNTLPPGMSRDTQLDAIPGVIPRNKKNVSPLHLDSPTLPTSTTQGRN